MFSERYLLSWHWNQLRGLCHAHKALELSEQNPITSYVSGSVSCVVSWRQRSFKLSNSNPKSSASTPKTKKMQAFKPLNDRAAQNRKSKHRYKTIASVPLIPQPPSQTNRELYSSRLEKLVQDIGTINLTVRNIYCYQQLTGRCSVFLLWFFTTAICYIYIHFRFISVIV